MLMLDSPVQPREQWILCEKQIKKDLAQRLTKTWGKCIYFHSMLLLDSLHIYNLTVKANRKLCNCDILHTVDNLSMVEDHT